MNKENITLENLRRVAVVGTSCSGKTTFAANLASSLNVKHIELDALYWLPDWVERPKDEFFNLVEKAVGEDDDAWVLDGNYSRTRRIVWGRATAIVWINYSFLRTFYRAMNRTLRRVVSGEEICAGNRETFGKAFMSRDSILLWVLTSYVEKRGEYTKLLGEGKPDDKEIFIFRQPKQAEEFLRQVRENRI